MKNNAIKYVVISGTAFICYFNTIFGTFVFDDSEAIVKNKDVMPFTPILDTFKNDFWGTDIALNLSHKSYRPLTILTYRLNVILSDSKLNAFHFHLTNVILYMILCVLTFPLYRAISKKVKSPIDLAFLASLLFTVHPVHTEVVACLVGRADILSSILFITALLLYRRFLKRPSKLLFVIVVVLIFCAVLCKETAITALAVCAALDTLHTKILYKSYSEILKTAKAPLSRITLLGAAGVLILYFRLWVMNFEGPTFTAIDNAAAYADNFTTRVLSYNYIYFLNVLLLVWPEWLCFDWSMGCIPLIETFCDIRIIYVLLLWIISLLVTFQAYKSFKNFKLSTSSVIGATLLIVPFIPASNLFLKVGFVIAERTLLLPSLGFCLLVVLGLDKLRIYFKDNKAPLGAFYALCVLFSIRSISRNSEWLTEETLFTSALKVCPSNAKVHYNIAKVAADKNNKDLALYEYRKAIELNENYEQAMNNLANLLREDKKFEEAEVLLRRALQVRPNFAAAWMNLGIVLSNLNQPEEAEKCYLQAIYHRNKYPDCYYNLGNLYLDMKRNQEALQAWEKAVYYRPTHISAWSNTLVLLDSLRRFEEVLQLGKTALMYNPKSPALHFSIANTLGKIQEFEKAEKHFLKALNFNPHNPLYHSNLGVLYHRWGKTDKAKDMYRKALQIDPSMKTTENNLKKLLNAQSNGTQ